MADYVSELAEQTFKILNTEKRPLLEKALDLLSDPRPTEAVSLARKLEFRADIQARLASLTGYTPSKWLLALELDHVEERRAKVVGPPVATPAARPPADTYERATNLGLMGLCFSGGGIRSATFNLGILQGLAELNLLRCFDYLSTVSGGGYIHQWFAAWSTRLGFEQVDDGSERRLCAGSRKPMDNRAADSRSRVTHAVIAFHNGRHVRAQAYPDFSGCYISFPGVSSYSCLSRRCASLLFKNS